MIRTEMTADSNDELLIKLESLKSQVETAINIIKSELPFRTIKREDGIVYCSAEEWCIGDYIIRKK